MNIGLLVCSTKKVNLAKVLFSCSICMILFVISGVSLQEQWRNILNIMTLKDHSENIGVYWYISIEVFKNHIDFFKYAYILFSFVMIFQIRQIVTRGYATIALCSQFDSEKYEKKHGQVTGPIADGAAKNFAK